MDPLSPQVVSAVKLPTLNPNEFDLWKMRIKQYSLMTDYSLWEVILNGDSPIPTRVVEVKQSSSTSPASQNLAFVSSSHTNITTDSVSAAVSVSSICAKLPTSTLPNVDSEDRSKMVDGHVDYAGLKVSSKDRQKSWKGHFARKCRSLKDPRRPGAAEPQRRIVLVETSTSNALVSQCDGTGSYDWSYQAEEEPTNFALIAFSSSSSFDNKTSEKIGLGYNLQVFTNAMFDCDNYYSSKSDCESWPPSNIYDRFQPSGRYHVVPPLYTGTFMPPKLDLVFKTAPTAIETDHLAFNVQLSPTKSEQDLSHITRPIAPIIEDCVSNSEEESETKATQFVPSFAQSSEHMKSSSHSDQPIETTILAATPIPASPKTHSSGKKRNKKACFVCKSVDHLIKDCDYHTKKIAQPTPRNYAYRGHHKHKSKSPIIRHITHSPSSKTSTSPSRVTVVKALVVSAAQGNMSYLSEFKELNGGYVSFKGNHKGGKITGKGKIKTGKLDFDDVYFVKLLKFNIFSVLQMYDKKNSVLFTDTECLVLSPNFKLPDENQVLVRVPRKNNMYNVNLKNIVPSGNLTCLFAKATIDESNLWHRRLGHINFKTINKLVKGNFVRGLPIKVFKNDNTCVAFKKGKQHRASCKTKPVSTVDQPLFRLYIDLFAPTFVKSLNKKSYFLVITDDYSRFTWVFFLATKDATSPILKTFITGLDNQLSLRIKNKVLVTKPHNKTLYELLHGRTPSIGFMRPFGCLVTILNTLDPLGKFQGKVDEGFLVGYSVCSKAFRVFNSQTRIIQKTMHVNFLENKPNAAGTGPTWLFNINSLTRTMNYQPVTAGNQTNSGAGFQDNFDAEKAGEEVDQQYVLFPVWSSGSTNPQDNDKDAALDGKEHDFDTEKPDSIVILSSSSSAQTKKQDDKTKIEDKGKSPVESFTRYIDLNAEFKDCSANSNNEVNATELEDITYSNDEDIGGAEANFNNLKSSIPVNPILTTRIHKDHPVSQIISDLNKKDERGIVIRNKARLIAQGHTQEEGINYEEVFAPVARIEVIRLFLAYASFMGFIVYQMDVKSAFLYGNIEKEVYVCQPPGFKDPNHHDKVYKVVKALYGLHQAPRVWYETLASYLLENGFQRGTIDQTLFIKKQKKDILLVKQKKDEIFISQDKYVAEILSKFGLTEGKSASTPIDTEKHLLKDPNGKDVDVHTYTLMIGFLMYLTSSRPDIMFATNDITRLQALVDKKKMVITEATIRDALSLDDAEGVDCLPNKEIFAELARMGYEKPSTKLTFYKAFFSSQWNILIHTILQSMSAKRTSWNEFSSAMASVIICFSTGRKFIFSKYIFESLVRNVDSSSKFYMYPRFIQLIIRNQLGDLSTHTTKYTSFALTQKVFSNMRRVGKGFSGAETPLFEGMLVAGVIKEEGDAEEQVQDVAEDNANQRDDTAIIGNVFQDQSIPSPTPPTPPPQQPQDLPSTSQRIDTSDDTVMEDASNQGKMIDDLDSNAGVALIDDKEEEKKVEEAKEDEPAEVQEVVDVVTTAKLIIKVVTTAKLIIEVVTAASESVTATSITIFAAEPQVPAATIIVVPIRVAAVFTKRRKGVVIKDLEEESTIIIPTDIKYQVMKKRHQTEAQARKNMIMYLKNVVGFRLDYFKGLSYNDIRPIFEAKFNLNIAFLLKTKEQLEEEENRAIQSINETPAQKAAKRSKLNKEVKDLKRHLETVPDEDDDVYIEATLLTRKKPNGQAQVWKNQRTVHGQVKVKSWKLLESYGVHIITFTTTQLILLVKRRYPLSRFTLDQMLNAIRLRVEEQSEMSLELLSTTDLVSDAASDSAVCAKLLASTLLNVDSLSNAVIYYFFASQSTSPQLHNEDLKQIDVDDLEEMDLRWQMAMLTMQARRFLKKTGRNLGVNGPTSIRFDMSKVECYNCHKKGHFSRVCRYPKDLRRPVQLSHKEGLSQLRPQHPMTWSLSVMVKEVMIGAIKQRGSLQTLLLWLFLSSSSSDNEVPSCSKACSKAYAQLHTQYDKLTDDFCKSQFDVISCQTGLESVEARLLVYIQNEPVFEENIKLLNIEVQLQDTALVTLRQKLEKAKKDRDDLKLKLEKFQTSSKNLTDFDYESWPPSDLYDRFQPSGGYHVVPPLYTRTFMPPKPDLVFNNAPTAVETNHLTFNVQLSPTKPEQDLSHTTRPIAPIIKDWVSDSEEESKTKATQFVPSFAQSYEHVKSPRHSDEPIKTTIIAATHVPASLKTCSSGKRRNRKACFYAPLTHSKPQKHMVPTAVLTQSKPVFNTAIRPVSAALPNITVTRPRYAYHVVTKSKSPIRRHITLSPSSKTNTSPSRVTVVKAPVVSAAQGSKEHGYGDQNALF
nr:putative ribonuclease H-like domain-containing protein [Tanacetum cinerariifolium]